jgi:hypothetical protein
VRSDKARSAGFVFTAGFAGAAAARYVAFPAAVRRIPIL